MEVTGFTDADTDRMETINRIPTNNGEWTADRTGYARVNFNTNNSTDANQSSVCQITKNGAIYESRIIGPGISNYYTTIKFSKGDVIKLSCERNFANCGLYYIPPKLVDEKPPTVSDEQFRNYFPVPDYTNRVAVSVTLDTDITAPASGFLRIQIAATTTGATYAYVYVNGGNPSNVMAREVFPSAGSGHTFIAEFPITQGDVFRVVWVNATITSQHCAIFRPKFESVMAPNSSYPFAETDANGYYDIYVSPSGNNLNDGLAATTPLQTIEQAFDNASKVEFTSKGAIRINLAAGEYTLTPDYVAPTIYTHVYLIGSGADRYASTVNVSGATAGWRNNYGGTLHLRNFTIKGEVTATTGQLLRLNTGVFELDAIHFEGTTLSVSYSGCYCNIGVVRFWDCSFKDIPIAVHCNGGFINVGFTYGTPSSGVQKFYNASAGVISTGNVPATWYTGSYKEESGGGRVIGYNTRLPSGVDLNTLIVQGVYNNTGGEIIVNGPSGLVASQNTLVEVQQLQDGSQGLLQHLKQFPVAATAVTSTGFQEWVRSGFNSSGTVTWGPWKRIITNEDVTNYDHVRVRIVRTDSAVKTWVRLAAIVTPTSSGNTDVYGITFDGRNNGDITRHAIGHLGIIVRNQGGTILVDTKLIKAGHADVEFGLTPIPSPGGIIDLFFCTNAYPYLVYSNTGTVMITPDGQISSPITTQPSGYTKIMPTALATA
jgi:hypothetical protein